MFTQRLLVCFHFAPNRAPNRGFAKGRVGLRLPGVWPVNPGDDRREVEMFGCILPDIQEVLLRTWDVV